MEEGTAGQHVMNMLFMTQHYVPLAASRTTRSTIFMPYSPGTVEDLQTEIQSGLLGVEMWEAKEKAAKDTKNALKSKNAEDQEMDSLFSFFGITGLLVQLKM